MMCLMWVKPCSATSIAFFSLASLVFQASLWVGGPYGVKVERSVDGQMVRPRGDGFERWLGRLGYGHIFNLYRLGVA